MSLAHFSMHGTRIDRTVIPGWHRIVGTTRGSQSDMRFAPYVIRACRSRMVMTNVRLVAVADVRRRLTFRHQMHPAFGAVTRLVLPDFGVHWASPEFVCGLVLIVTLAVGHVEDYTS